VGVEQRVAVDAPERSWAHDLRGRLQTVTSLADFKRCGRQWARQVEIVMAPSGETRRRGIHACRNVNVCPVCWSRRRIQERAEIVHAGSLWAAAGGGLGKLVITVPHRQGETLADVLARLDDRTDSLRKGRAGVELRNEWGVEGLIRATEITWGRAGWHPHQHWLMFGREPFSDPARAGLWRWIKDRWSKRATKDPESPLYKPDDGPSDVSAIDPGDLDDHGGHITKGPSRSTEERYYQALANNDDMLAMYLAPFVFGDEAAAGDPFFAAVWREYEQTVHGSQWIRWSNGFRARFGLGVAGRVPALEGEVIATFGVKPADPSVVGPAGATVRSGGSGG
jgi:hypothetical protein